jgi:S1-C subfamily serine protease
MVALTLPFALLAGTTNRVVSLVAERAAGALTTLAGAAARAGSSPETRDALPATTGTPAPLRFQTDVEQPPRSRRAPPARPGNVYISARLLRRLAEGSARPSGEFVAATSSRPAGLRLSGVAELGLGLHDGDVLIEALGQPATNSGQLVEAIVAARTARAPQLSGKLWRGGYTFGVTVEQPY